MTMTKVGRGRVACKPDTNVNKSSIKSERQLALNFKVIQSYVKITASFRYGSDYSPRSGANSYKAGNDDVFSLFHAETD